MQIRIFNAYFVPAQSILSLAFRFQTVFSLHKHHRNGVKEEEKKIALYITRDVFDNPAFFAMYELDLHMDFIFFSAKLR